jgi:hypothetical protein
MKNFFFMAILMAVPLAILGALLYSVAKYVWSLYQDKKLYRELDEIEAECKRRRQQPSQERQSSEEIGIEP